MRPIRFRYLFHGTSSKYRASIDSGGLLPVNGRLYLTTHPAVALEEAENTIRGEPHLAHGYKRGIGGHPLIVKIARVSVKNLRLDLPGYYDKESPEIRRLVPKRFAFTTDAMIRPEHLEFIDSDFETEFDKLLSEIHLMSRLLPFQYPPDIENAIMAERFAGTVMTAEKSNNALHTGLPGASAELAAPGNGANLPERDFRTTSF